MVARSSSTRSGKRKTSEGDTEKPVEDSVSSELIDTDESAIEVAPVNSAESETAQDLCETPPGADGPSGDDTVTVEDAEIVDDTAGSDIAAGDENAEDAADTNTPSAPAPSATPAPTEASSGGSGFVPLLAGGIVAAGIGYGAAFMGLLPVPGPETDLSGVEAAINTQSEALSTLQAELSTLAAVEPPAAPEVDLGPVLAEIAALSDRLDASIEELSGRVTDLENRPVFSGEVDADNAAMAAAVDQLQSELREQEDRNAAMAEELRTLADEAQAGIADAQAAIAEAETRAQESVAAATAQAALSRIRIAMASGDPFADALGDLPGSVSVPGALVAAAEAGVPTLADLQQSFPAAARAALPIAIRETAGDSATDRLGAFLRGQVGGRSIEPREGDDPDAILSRAQAAVTSGDLTSALTEIASLPDTAQAEMSGWVATATARQEADAALDTLATALDGAN